MKDYHYIDTDRMVLDPTAPLPPIYPVDPAAEVIRIQKTPGWPQCTAMRVRGLGRCNRLLHPEEAKRFSGLCVVHRPRGESK